MPFEKGHKPYPGASRKPGVKNKRRSIEDLCTEHGVDPFLVMVNLLSHSDDAMKFQSAKELCQYLEAKKKSLDVAIDPEANVIKVIIEDYGTKD